MLKLVWEKHNNSSDLGQAQVEEIISNNECQMFDLDSWWGICTSREEAQIAAEEELLRWK